MGVQQRMKILVIGGTKFIGKEMVRLLLAQGHDVVLFNRGSTESNPTLPTIQGNAEEILTYKNELLATKADVVVHCIAYTEKHARDCVEIFQDTSTHVIVLSSQDCYEVFRQLVLGKETFDFPVNETSPTSSVKYYWRGLHSHREDYDKNLMTEVFVIAFEKKKLSSTVFRLPMVYGPGDPQYAYRHGNIIHRIIDQEKDFVLGQREQNQIFTYGFIENIAAAMIHSLDHPKTRGKIYNLGETLVRSKRRWAELYAQEAGWKFNFHIIPDELLQKDSSTRNQPPQQLITDCSLYKSDTGFVPPVTLEEGIKQTLAWGKEHIDVLGEKPNYKKELELKDCYLKWINEWL